MFLFLGVERVDNEIFVTQEAISTTESSLEVTYPRYVNKTKIIRNFDGDLGAQINGTDVTGSISISRGASGALCYCKSTRNDADICYKSMCGFTPFQ